MLLQCQQQGKGLQHNLQLKAGNAFQLEFA
jgi:hypothetical protein